MNRKQRAIKIYWDLIRKAIKRDENGPALTAKNFAEKHHVIPRYMGGDTIPNNIVKLTPREHSFAHRMLYYAGYEAKEGTCAGNDQNITKLAVGRAIFRKHWTSIFKDKDKVMAIYMAGISSKCSPESMKKLFIKMVDMGFLEVDKKKF